jgi:hypothetical protein
MTPPTDRRRPEPGWGRATGHVGIDPAGPVEEVSPALDRLLVMERIARYGWAYDERDRAALADCFTHDGTWDGSVMGQEAVGPFSGRDAVADFLAGFWETQHDQRRHLFTNVVLGELSPAGATAHAYLLLASTEDAVLRPVSAGPYRFTLRKDGGVWRIRRLSAGFDCPF